MLRGVGTSAFFAHARVCARAHTHTPLSINSRTFPCLSFPSPLPLPPCLPPSSALCVHSSHTPRCMCMRGHACARGRVHTNTYNKRPTPRTHRRKATQRARSARQSQKRAAPRRLRRSRPSPLLPANALPSQNLRPTTRKNSSIGPPRKLPRIPPSS